MQITKTNFGTEVKEKLKKGISSINDIVSITMGPFGRNVLYENDYGTIQSTKDGVSCAKMIKTLEDPIENFGAQIIKQAAIKTVDQAGDGTTTSTVLANSIAIQALDIVGYGSVNANEVKRGIEDATKIIINELRRQSIPLKDESQILQVATLSSNGDSEIGNLVTTALEKVGRDGVVTVEDLS